MKGEGFKLAFYRKIPAYYNESTHEIIGRNWIFDKLIAINVFVDFKLIGIEYLPILVKE